MGFAKVRQIADDAAAEIDAGFSVVGVSSAIKKFKKSFRGPVALQRRGSVLAGAVSGSAKQTVGGKAVY